MELPSCPSCGQSVLDDDVDDCPFCGASMKGGKSKGRTALSPAAQAEAAAADSAGPAAKEKPEDPFAVKQELAAGRNAVKCSPRPTKSRRQKITCPMCDTVGYIPAAAIGRQVRCANPECLVPVFEAVDPEASADPAAPARVSDSSVPKKKDRTAAGGSSFRLYAIIGGIGLAGAAGLIYWLNSGDAPDPNLNVPVTIPDFGDPDPQPTEVADTPDSATGTEPQISPNQSAAAIVAAMKASADSRTNNRSKALCRRLLADAYLLINQPDEAQRELDQVRVADPNLVYYRIQPAVTGYWNAVAAGDNAAASEWLKTAVEDRASVRSSGRTELELQVALAAALCHAGRADEAVQQIREVQADQSKLTQRDRACQAAWFAVADSADRTGISPPSLHAAYLWNEPLMTAVAAGLAARNQYNAALQWVKQIEDNSTWDDTAALLATFVRSAPGDTGDVGESLKSAAASRSSVSSLRINAALADSNNSGPELTAAADAVAADPGPEFGAIDVRSVLNSATRKLDIPADTAKAFAEAAAALTRIGADNEAAAALVQMHKLLAAAVPPTAAARTAVNTMLGSQRQVESEIRSALSLTPSESVTKHFNRYRQYLDRIARAAEERRLTELQLLAMVAAESGGNTLNSAMNLSAELKQEVCADELSRIVASAGQLQGSVLNDCAQPPAELRVSLPDRTRSTVELLKAALNVWPVMADATAAATQGETKALTFDVPRTTVPGMPAIHRDVLIRSWFADAEHSAEDLGVIAESDNEVDVEYGLATAVAVLADSGRFSQAADWLASARLSSTARCMAGHALVEHVAGQSSEAE